MDPRNARRGYYSRVAKRREKNLLQGEKMNATVPATNNRRRNWLIAVAVLAIATLCCGGLSIAAFRYGQNRSENVAPTCAAQPTAPIVVSTPISPKLETGCGAAWKTDADITQYLLPGLSTRGDVVANDVPYYDSGIGEGTTIRNMSNQPIKIYQQWGSGCEDTTDLNFLINKDLQDGCGSQCSVVRIVTFTNEGITEEFYTEPIE